MRESNQVAMLTKMPQYTGTEWIDGRKQAVALDGGESVQVQQTDSSKEES